MEELRNSSSMAAPSEGEPSAQLTVVSKRRRSLPGTPDPDAEVIALSPKSLLATNRFVCEICSKGFQRDQNLQLHRRGHNLPWTLKQRGGKPKRRVYVCPETTCVHHHPSRALGDLTGIKKHFCRKHGEKKFKCERCSKKYAVRSDWKAHTKTCGTKEYRCDCGTIFSRKDSFITHRAFCDALAQETIRCQPLEEPSKVAPPPTTTATSSSSPPPPPLTPSTGVLSPVVSVQSADLPENQSGLSHHKKGTLPTVPTTIHTACAGAGAGVPLFSTSNVNGEALQSVFASSTVAGDSRPTQLPPAPAPGSAGASAEPMFLSLSCPIYLSGNAASSVFPWAAASQDLHRQYAAPSRPPPALSATALLQKAAEIGATSSHGSFLCGLGLATSSGSNPQDGLTKWNEHVKQENKSISSPSSPTTMIFTNNPPTLDFLGVGAGATPASFLGSMNNSGGGGGVASTGDCWDDTSDRKFGFH
ncbi:PREDICTED: protein indeterminate-domain 2-like [Ipomoea nil]|uniref:protein indeterminate-domain 2-like n=1 Tax=Ipomoea nil TaxID=35883 RepID=UPI0009017BDC|nr:PREDICTED: protein indeterminate-domain 2-like [Ipomoea nil]XP_019153413.1 PREDICTED: protein indeterminate-domain 2-like [Ipomoea nil]XP_019153414.1 PREDICTED: protein indeterminate-domain 2-like [Ipomoea nil]